MPCMRDASPLGGAAVYWLRLIAVALTLLGLIVTTAEIGHAHAGAAAASDGCAVCLHARSVAITPSVARVVEPILVPLAVPPPRADAPAFGLAPRTCGRAPPVLRFVSR